QWRLPRDTEVAAEEEEKGLIASFIEGAVTTIHDWLKSAFDVIKDGIKAIEKKISGLPCMKGKSGKQAARGGSGMSVSAEMLIYLILVALLVVLVIVFIRIRRTKELVHEVEEAPVQEASEPDLTREEITAKELPANNWLGLARSLMAKGEKRLALRALYLAGIAHLADRELLSVEAFKSNRDYQRELERRAHALPEVVSAFSLTMRLFEDVWYGTHEVTENLLDTFDQNHKKVMALE
ncbi:MAG: DUF4129 domain-containing protein, partial [Akkermansiaceae bacterium]|nr:DUF4129 domain-containing protein [Akkermansiaceae bacterium]NIS11470.1 DUF4129 domain-containing protein [Thermoplasmata archaeon]NIT76516.1 DUF4129 domain-containing protein [Thermoplasmata archaeon]NIY02887.1 DUF4129 domain-containing protein [Thermoplasmata archaeon]